MRCDGGRGQRQRRNKCWKGDPIGVLEVDSPGDGVRKHGHESVTAVRLWMWWDLAAPLHANASHCALRRSSAKRQRLALLRLLPTCAGYVPTWRPRLRPAWILHYRSLWRCPRLSLTGNVCHPVFLAFIAFSRSFFSGVRVLIRCCCQCYSCSMCDFVETCSHRGVTGCRCVSGGKQHHLIGFRTKQSPSVASIEEIHI